MDVRQAIASNLRQADFFIDAYLGDITPDEMMVRPVPGANHLAWQLGHLISSEHRLVERVAPGTMPALPPNFAERHTKQTAASDKADEFFSKEEYLQTLKQVRASTLRVVEILSPTELDRPVDKVPPMVKTAGQALLLIGGHWMLHAGQWALLRRKLGRSVQF